MFTNLTISTAQIPSGFALPMCGHASFRATGVVLGATEVVVRDRQADTAIRAAAADKRTTRTTAYFPGTTAWRPPIC
ncbi:hypothetical protein [Nocardioides sp. Arc9.136]|uniref:hypothetical protein n=1 Tax=Nocardioides sp. Arc9.136 TaxID=2996826 RepID=UPI0026661F61|nr:hypothetical protein [Nocardioides sp. Arc9.136]WKN47490.1 hypothetical protein OSR43_15795 [Nocardioides sp. Arc9.136]